MAKKKIRDVMTQDPVTLAETETCIDAAREMARDDIGDVIVCDDDGRPCGIVTDRDLVVRVLSKDMNASQVKLGQVCTRNLVTIDADADEDQAIRLMRRHAVRRLPVVEEGGRLCGVVSLGDLAVDRDPQSVLAAVSAAPPNN